VPRVFWRINKPIYLQKNQDLVDLFPALTSALSGYACQAIDMAGFNYIVGTDGVRIYDDDLNFIDSVSYTFATLETGAARADVVDGYLYVLSSASLGTLYRMSIETKAIENLGVIPEWNISFYYSAEFLMLGDLMVQAAPNNTDATLNVRLVRFYSLSSGLETLGDIVEAECLASGLLESSDIDVTELTDQVRGYRVSQLGAIRASIEPLRAVWPFDVIQHGYDIQFKKRGSASVATITAAELDARSAGDEPGVRITDVREMDLQLPQKVSIKYLDAVREYDTGDQYDERLNTDAVNHTEIDLPVVLNADEAKQTASMLLYMAWMERYDVAFNLPPTYQHLEPGDVVTIEADNADYELRLVSVHYLADGRLDCRAKYNRAAIYTQIASGEEGSSTGQTLTLAGPTALQLLDIPLMRDDDDTAGLPGCDERVS
jgi:hypothetical protein